MMFILGIIVGLLISILIMVTLIFFKKPIEQKFKVIGTQIGLKGLRPKGFIVEPPDEAEEVRANIIARNKALGRDTKIEDLR